MTPVLRVYFHPRSPYARLGLHKVQQENMAAKAEMSIHAFAAPPDGTPFFNPTDSKAKLRYLMKDAPRMTMRAGLPIMPPQRPEPDYAAAIDAFYVAREAGKGLDYALALADARWGRSLDIGSADVLRQLAEETGVDGDITAPSSGAAQEDRDAINKDQVFGVPFAALEIGGETHLFWGHERFELLAEMLS